jgi:hypothetical protein
LSTAVAEGTHVLIGWSSEGMAVATRWSSRSNAAGSTLCAARLSAGVWSSASVYHQRSAVRARMSWARLRTRAGAVGYSVMMPAAQASAAAFGDGGVDVPV